MAGFTNDLTPSHARLARSSVPDRTRAAGQHTGPGRCIQNMDQVMAPDTPRTHKLRSSLIAATILAAALVFAPVNYRITLRSQPDL